MNREFNSFVSIFAHAVESPFTKGPRENISTALNHCQLQGRKENGDNSFIRHGGAGHTDICTTTNCTTDEGLESTREGGFNETLEIHI